MTLRLLNGDCLQLMKTLPDKSIDCFICDLPYGQIGKKGSYYDVGVEGTHNRGNRITWDVKIDLVQFWEQVQRLAKNDHVPIIHFCNTKFGIDLINSNPSWFRYDLVWNKQRGVSFLSANKMPMKSHEMIYIFAKKSATYKRIDVDDSQKKADSQFDQDITKTTYSGNVYGMPNLTRAKGCPSGKRCCVSVINVTKIGTLKDLHPTQKPKELYKWLLERYCPADGVVLDPTAGSCHSVEVARELGLHGIGIEMDKKYYDNAVKRLLETAVVNEFMDSSGVVVS
jgi:site-specific DNA-methyltransferase (adenine-specific)